MTLASSLSLDTSWFSTAFRALSFSSSFFSAKTSVAMRGDLHDQLAVLKTGTNSGYKGKSRITGVLAKYQLI